MTVYDSSVIKQHKRWKPYEIPSGSSCVEPVTHLKNMKSGKTCKHLKRTVNEADIPEGTRPTGLWREDAAILAVYQAECTLFKKQIYILPNGETIKCTKCAYQSHFYGEDIFTLLDYDKVKEINDEYDKLPKEKKYVSPSIKVAKNLEFCTAKIYALTGTRCRSCSSCHGCR